jgi:hypothetical protein
MKKMLKMVALCMAVMCLSLSTAAFVPIQPLTAATATMALAFSGNNANCDITITGASGTTRIDNVTVILRDDTAGREVARWSNLSANGTTFRFSRIANPVTQGRTYTLSFTATVHRNGVATPIGGDITRRYN